jgi:hypothetical protein
MQVFGGSYTYILLVNVVIPKKKGLTYRPYAFTIRGRFSNNETMLTNVELLIFNALAKGMLNLNSARTQFHAVSKSPAC